MRAASLHYVKLYRTHLAAYMVTGKLFKIFTDTRQIFMTECVGGFRAARKAVYTLGYGNDNSLVSFGYSFHVLKVMFFRKVAFGKVNKVWCGFAVCTQYTGRCREPACVTSHYFYYRNGRNGVYPAVTDDFLQCCSNVFCRRAETGSMVGKR